MLWLYNYDIYIIVFVYNLFIINIIMTKIYHVCDSYKYFKISVKRLNKKIKHVEKNSCSFVIL